MCVDWSSGGACKILDNVKLQGRNKNTFACVELNAPVGVDMCTEISTYCIDTQSDPTRCSDLTSKYTCFIGREQGSQICVFESTDGPNKYGVDYCKKGYCIYTKDDGTRTCEALSEKDGLRGKNSTTHCSNDQIPGMIECANRYCIDNIDSACYPFSRQRQGM